MRRNGIDVDLFHGWVDTIRKHPEAGGAAVGVRHRWDEGFAVDGRSTSFAQGGEVMTRTHHTFRTDWPDPFGADSGPTPGAESVLATLGACVATTYILKATAQGIVIDELEVTTEGRVDLQGLLEMGAVRPGFSDVTVTIGVRSGADEGVLEELGRIVANTSPAYDSLVHPVPAQVCVQRLPQAPQVSFEGKDEVS